MTAYLLCSYVPQTPTPTTRRPLVSTVGVSKRRLQSLGEWASGAISVALRLRSVRTNVTMRIAAIFVESCRTVCFELQSSA